MPRSTADQSVIDYRREMVAKYLLRKYSLRRIAKAVADEGSINPDTGGVWDATTIMRDVRALRTAWQREAGAKVERHQSLLMAELDEVKREAWVAGDYDAVRRAIESQWKIIAPAGKLPESFKPVTFTITGVIEDDGDGETDAAE